MRLEEIVSKLRVTATHLRGLDSCSGDAELFSQAATLIESLDADVGSLNEAGADAYSEAAAYRSVLLSVDHTLSAHGHMDADTDLHKSIWGVLGLEEAPAGRRFRSRSATGRRWRSKSLTQNSSGEPDFRRARRSEGLELLRDGISAWNQPWLKAPEYRF
jgi:hypothetical protein